MSSSPAPSDRHEDVAASSYAPLDARLGRTSSEPVETTKGKPVRSRPLRKKSDAAKPQRLARLQTWLQGCYPHAPHRPWFMWRLGNLISDLRYWVWRLQGGKHYGE